MWLTDIQHEHFYSANEMNCSHESIHQYNSARNGTLKW